MVNRNIYERVYRQDNTQPLQRVDVKQVVIWSANDECRMYDDQAAAISKQDIGTHTQQKLRILTAPYCCQIYARA